jgi:cell division inhibitor SepF
MGKLKNVFKKFLGFEDDLEAVEDEVNLEEELKRQRSFYGAKEPEDYEQVMRAPIEAQIDRTVNNEIKRHEIIIYPKNYSEACDIIEQIELGHLVTVNMEHLDIDTSKRISDFVLGAVYVLQGDVEKCTGKVFRFWIDK